MHAQRKWIVWLSIFLSLFLLMLSLGISGKGDRTQAAAERTAYQAPVRKGGGGPQLERELGKTFRYIDGVVKAEQARRAEAARRAAEEAAREAREAQRVGAASTAPPVDYGASTGRCGGTLPPCSVMMKESGGNIYAFNATGCGGRGCRGKWQCDPNTCSGTGTEAEQDAEAEALWNNGAGCANWDAC